MKKIEAEKLLRRVRLELARDPDPSHDESGFRFERHAFLPGEYVSIKEQDDVLRTFRVASGTRAPREVADHACRLQRID
jgi:hypothetical protein